MKLFFVRHAKSIANEEDKALRSELKEKHGGGDHLHPHCGFRQADELVGVLKQYEFDHIYISPSKRTIQTIAPYLREVKRRGVILPMATEIEDSPLLSLPNLFGGEKARNKWIGKLLGQSKTRTKPIEKLTEFDDVLTYSPEFPDTEVKGEAHADGVARAHRLARFLRKQHGHTEESVLLVSHGTMGRFLLAHLTQDESIHLHHPDNAKLWLLLNADGKFHIKINNGNVEGNRSSKHT